MTSPQIDSNTLWKALEEVKDPEVPVLSIIDLGIVRAIDTTEDSITVTITPTYTGCPAMDMIATDIKFLLAGMGYKKITIHHTLSPAWTTDWMSEEGKKKLREYGIAPPLPRQQVCNNDLFAPNEAIPCPRCNSYSTRRISEFGSTACKALYQCNDCQEPFDYFKCH